MKMSDELSKNQIHRNDAHIGHNHGHWEENARHVDATLTKRNAAHSLCMYRIVNSKPEACCLNDSVPLAGAPKPSMACTAGAGAGVSPSVRGREVA